MAIKRDGASNSIVMHNGTSPVAAVALSQQKVFLRIDMDFTNKTDKASF